MAIKQNRCLEPDDLTNAVLKSGGDFVRELVRQRDGRQCRRCGKQQQPGKRRLDVHHLNGLCGKREQYEDKIEDMPGLITLCRKCHFNHPEYNPYRRIGRIPNKHTKLERVRELAAKGYLKSQIAKDLGVTHACISQIVARYHIPVRLYIFGRYTWSSNE